jgi:hypothetical protein
MPIIAAACTKMLRAEVEAYAQAGIAPATKRAYRADLNYFEAWGRTIPARDAQVAARGSRRRAESIHVQPISVAHDEDSPSQHRLPRLGNECEIGALLVPLSGRGKRSASLSRAPPMATGVMAGRLFSAQQQPFSHCSPAPRRIAPSTHDTLTITLVLSIFTLLST